MRRCPSRTAAWGQIALAVLPRMRWSSSAASSSMFCQPVLRECGTSASSVLAAEPRSTRCGCWSRCRRNSLLPARRGLVRRTRPPSKRHRQRSDSLTLPSLPDVQPQPPATRQVAITSSAWHLQSIVLLVKYQATGRSVSASLNQRQQTLRLSAAAPLPPLPL